VPALTKELTEFAAAKVNLTLSVGGRRADGYHDLESLVAFAQERDTLRLRPASALSLRIEGPNAGNAGMDGDNLVLRAARNLQRLVAGLKTGVFLLTKNLPIAAGLGGGSADAAAALRLLAALNGFAGDDPRLAQAARDTGSDVPVCLDPEPRIMRGRGEILSAPLAMPALFAVLVNPGLPAATARVFAAFDKAGARSQGGNSDATPDFQHEAALLDYLRAHPNDLEAAAIAVQPAIANVLAALRALPGCRLARMSGSGATCFGLFAAGETSAAARDLQRKYPSWWIRETVLGAG